jgi:hypothetical protein
MSNNSTVQDVVIDLRTLCLILDETGQEEFKNTQVFGIGGVAGFGIELMRAERRWRRMRQDYFQGEGKPLHGSGKKMTEEQLRAVSTFFKCSRLPRFAFLLRKPDNMPAGLNALHFLRPFLMEQFVQFVGDRDRPPEEIIIVFERSQRLEPKLRQVFPGMTMEVDGKAIKISGVLAEKSSE